jgi:hypothetical protein
MPNLIPHIDKICREKQRDVLTVEFHDNKTEQYQPYQFNESRQIILAWLNAKDIPHSMCGPFASETKTEAYRGQIYIDVPFEKTNPTYLMLENFLENSDGSSKFPSAYFKCYSLKHCMSNAHHDAPNFWENLLEDI